MFSVSRFAVIAFYLTCTASVSNTAHTTNDIAPDSVDVCESQERKLDDKECKSKENDEETDKMYSSEGNNDLAVVPYNENDLFPHQKAKRKFNFAGQEIHIAQRWQDMGVAAVVWDAAVVLCEYFEKNPQLVNGKSVLELGAGTGLVGMVAALLGGVVIVTEREEAVQNLREIIKENIPKEKQIHAEVLDWTEDLSNFGPHYDVVVGADIVYIEETFSHLQRTLLHVCSKTTMLLLSCKIRYQRDRTFFSLLTENFTVEELFHDHERDIVIYSAKRK